MMLIEVFMTLNFLYVIHADGTVKKVPETNADWRSYRYKYLKYVKTTPTSSTVSATTESTTTTSVLLSSITYPVFKEEYKFPETTNEATQTNINSTEIPESKFLLIPINGPYATFGISAYLAIIIFIFISGVSLFGLIVGIAICARRRDDEPIKDLINPAYEKSTNTSTHMTNSYSFNSVEKSNLLRDPSEIHYDSNQERSRLISLDGSSDNSNINNNSSSQTGLHTNKSFTSSSPSQTFHLSKPDTKTGETSQTSIFGQSKDDSKETDKLIKNDEFDTSRFFRLSQHTSDLFSPLDAFIAEYPINFCTSTTSIQKNEPGLNKNNQNSEQSINFRLIESDIDNLLNISNPSKNFNILNDNPYPKISSSTFLSTFTHQLENKDKKSKEQIENLISNSSNPILNVSNTKINASVENIADQKAKNRLSTISIGYFPQQWIDFGKIKEDINNLVASINNPNNPPSATSLQANSFVVNGSIDGLNSSTGDVYLKAMNEELMAQKSKQNRNSVLVVKNKCFDPNATASQPDSAINRISIISMGNLSLDSGDSF